MNFSPLLCGALLAAASPALAQGQAALAATNPFAKQSTLPYQAPPFDQIHDADFAPAFAAGMAEQMKEVRAIADNKDAPTFENTIVALERSGQLLGRASLAFFNLTSSNTDPTLDALQADLAPKLAAHQDAIFLDQALFGRVKTLFDNRASLKLDPESERVLERYHTLFVRAGANLSPADKATLKTMNGRISTLTTEFQQNVLKARKAGAVVVDDVKALDGFSPQQVAAAAQAAKDRKLTGKWVIALQNTTGQPALANLTNRALREKIYNASIARGGFGKEGDNTGVIAELVKVRAERAKLLGYKNHAAYTLEDQSAKTPEAVDQMLNQLAPPALANAKREAAELQKEINAEAKANHTKSFKLQPWDWAFYSEKVRKAKFDYDESEVRPYFELNHVLNDGVFYAAHRLYGVSFKERHDLPVYQKDVRVFDVLDVDGTPLGLFIGDYFARDNKQGGAWMSNYVNQSFLLGQLPVVVNNINIPKPPEGQPALLTFDEVTTMFHEFGHAMHGLFSKVKYPLISGTSVPRDFVEYPSQYNEMWASNPEVFANYAKHFKTGQAMPQALVKKVLAAKNYGEGFATLEYLEAAMYDMSWHEITAAQAPDAKHVAAFETAALKKDKVDYAPVPPRYLSPYFLHIFSNGYEAGYYAYIWSGVLAADTEHWMKTHGGLQRANGDFLRAKILSRGFTEEPGTLFQDFYGKGPEIEWLLESRGLVLPKASKAKK